MTQMISAQVLRWQYGSSLHQILLLQSEFQNQVYHLFPGYRIVVIGVELLEYIAAKMKTLFVQQALRKGNKFASGDYPILIYIKDIK